MENISSSASDIHHSDEVDYFEEDYVLSALNLVVNFPVPPQKSPAAKFEDNEEELSFNQESRRIDDVIKKLGDIVFDEKDKEISSLKCQLENKNTQIQQLEEKLTKLVIFITFMHGRFGSLMDTMSSMTRSGDNESFLYFGPFNEARTKNEFVQILKDLSAQFSSDYEDLVGTRGLMEKADSILKRMKEANQNKITGNVQASAPNWLLRNYSQSQSNASVAENFNGEMHSSTFPLLTTSPINLTTRASITSYPSIRRPPPSMSRNCVQNDYGRNLASVNKKHGVDHSKRHWGYFCLCQGTKFKSKANLMIHIKNFTVHKKFECSICNRRYMFPSMLRKHLISSHKIENFIDGIVTCSICQGNYRSYPEFHHHLETYHHFKERALSKQKSTDNKSGSDCHYSGQEDIPPDQTLEINSNSTITLHYASVD